MLNLTVILIEKKGFKKNTAFRQFSDSVDTGEMLAYIDTLVNKCRIGGFYKSLRIVVARSAGADPCFQDRLFDLTFYFNKNKNGNIKKDSLHLE